RPAGARGEGDRRRRRADRVLLRGARNRQSRIAARHRGGAAGRPGALRAQYRSHAVRGRRGQSGRSGGAHCGRAQIERSAAWRRRLNAARLPLYDVHWTPAIVVDKRSGRNSGDTIRVGLGDGRVLPLTVWNAAIRRKLNAYDVIYVRVVEAKGRGAARAELRVRPSVQGAAL